MTDLGAFIFSPESNVEKAKGTVQPLREEHSVDAMDARGKAHWFHWTKSMPVKKISQENPIAGQSYEICGAEPSHRQG